MKYLKLFEDYIKNTVFFMDRFKSEKMPTNKKSWEEFIHFLKTPILWGDRVDDVWDDYYVFFDYLESELIIRDCNLQECILAYLEEKELTPDNIDDIIDSCQSGTIMNIFNVMKLPYKKFSHWVADRENLHWILHIENLFYYYHELLSWAENSNDKTVYRSIDTPIETSFYDNNKYYGLGLFWSYDKRMAQSYNSNHPINYHIEMKAEITPDNIDWSETIYKSIWQLAEEREIYLNEDSVVNIVEISVDGNLYPLPNKTNFMKL